MSNASQRVMAANPRLDSLRKILAQERASGYQDLTVIGGLDRFLQHWAEELEPVLRGAGSYSILTPLQREEWAGTVGPRLRAGGEDEPKPSKRARPRAPRRVPPVPLDTAVSDLKGVAKQTLPKLKRLGLQKVEDLVYHFPHRHNDFAQIGKVSDLKPGEEQTVVVSVWEASETRQGQKRRSTQAVLGDETGNVRAIWFNQPYLASTFKPGTSLVISGKVNVFRGSLVFQSPEYEILRGQEELVHTGRLVPVYPSVDGLPQRDDPALRQTGARHEPVAGRRLSARGHEAPGRVDEPPQLHSAGALPGRRGRLGERAAQAGVRRAVPAAARRRTPQEGVAAGGPGHTAGRRGVGRRRVPRGAAVQPDRRPIEGAGRDHGPTCRRAGP